MLDKKRIIIGTFLAIVITLLFLLIPASNIFCLIILSSICAIGVWEFYSLLIAGEIPSSKKLGTFISIIFSIATWYYMHSCKNLIYKSYISDVILWSIMASIIIITFYRLLAYDDMREGLFKALGTLLGFIYIPFLFSFFIRIFLINEDLSVPAYAAFYIVLCTKISDTGGYFIGSKFGKNKLAKIISPKKSWEGLYGGILFCLVVNIFWKIFIEKYVFFSIPVIHILFLSFLIPLFGTAGDLVESLFKRAVKIKDSSTITYGIGGILDMIDSLLFTAPMFYIYYEFLLK